GSAAATRSRFLSSLLLLLAATAAASWWWSARHDDPEPPRTTAHIQNSKDKESSSNTSLSEHPPFEARHLSALNNLLVQDKTLIGIINWSGQPIEFEINAEGNRIFG